MLTFSPHTPQKYIAPLYLLSILMKLLPQLALTIISAVTLPLCFPPIGCSLLILLIYPTLLWITSKTSARRAFYLGFLHSILGYGASLFWLKEIFATAAIPLYAIMAVFTALFCLFNNYYQRQPIHPLIRVLIAASLWTAIEYYRCEWFALRFPWITPGTAIGPTILSPIVGTYGATFVIIAAAAAFLQRKTLPLAAGLTIFVLGIILIRPPQIDVPNKDRIAVSLIQSESSQLSIYVNMTREIKADAPDLIVWPEYAVAFDIRNSPRHLKTLTDLCAEMDATIVLGTQTVPDPKESVWFNTALTINKHGVLGDYYKARPVHFFDDGTPGTTFDPIQTHLGSIGTPICFDNDYTEVPRRIAANGAEFFVAPTFDAEGWTLTEHVQHALMYRLRAAETHRWYAVAASSGISQFIDPNGNVHRTIKPMYPGTETYHVARNTRQTFFVRVGWMLPWLCIGTSVGLFIATAVKRKSWKKRREANSSDPKN